MYFICQFPWTISFILKDQYELPLKKERIVSMSLENTPVNKTDINLQKRSSTYTYATNSCYCDGGYNKLNCGETWMCYISEYAPPKYVILGCLHSCKLYAHV